MIINTIIRGTKAGDIQLSSQTPLFIVKNLGEQLSIDFTYINSQNAKGIAVLYLNDYIIKISNELSDGDQVSFDITENVTSTGYYSIKLVCVDKGESTDSVAYNLLFNFDNLGDFEFSFNSVLNGYNLITYNGNDSIINIPPIFNGPQGTLQVVRIANSAFFDNDIITEVKIPDSISSIGANAFFGCSNLSRVEVSRDIPPILEQDNVFDPYTEFSVLKIYVPSESVSLYKTAENWDEYSSDIFAI
jgi:hypothetical protein